MDILVNVNWWAVLAGMVVAMAIGSIWYSQLMFGSIWQQELKIKVKEMGGSDPTSAMIGAALLTLIQAIVLAVLIGSGDVTEGIRVSTLVGVGLVATGIGVQYCFEGRSLRLLLINAGYMVVTIVSMGVIIGAWH